MNRPCIAVIACLLSILFSSCRKEQSFPEISLPATQVMRIQSNWGVVTSSHLRLREKPDISSRAIATLWRGFVLEILSQDFSKQIIENHEGYWYQVIHSGLHGWVFGAYIDFFDSRDAAERVSRELRN